MTKEKEFNYIPWIDADSFQLRVILGSQSKYYNLFFRWNVKGRYWSASCVTDEAITVITNRRLVLNTDLFENIHSDDKPDCYLVPVTDDERILELNKNVMISGQCKLIEILYEDTN